MKVNICSETLLLNVKSDGVHTSFTDSVELLHEDKNIEVLINNEGVGDVMHSHTYGPYFFWRGLKYKGKRILTVHVIPDSIKGSLPAWKLLMPLARWYFKKVFSYADVCIAISPTVEKAIKDLSVKTAIVRLSNPMYIDKWKRTAELRQKGREMLKLNNNDFCVLGVGQLEPRKGCEDFIDIGEQIPYAQFRWVGGRPLGIFTEGIRRLNHRINKATPNIMFTGAFDHNDMPAIYAAADLFLFPSYQENCPLAPLEAAASGIPVVFRDIKEYSSLYEHEYLKSCCTKDFIKITKRLIVDESFYNEAIDLSENLVTQFDKNNVRKKLVELYIRLAVNEKSPVVSHPSLVISH